MKKDCLTCSRRLNSLFVLAFTEICKQTEPKQCCLTSYMIFQLKNSISEIHTLNGKRINISVNDPFFFLYLIVVIFKRLEMDAKIFPSMVPIL